MTNIAFTSCNSILLWFTASKKWYFLVEKIYFLRSRIRFLDFRLTKWHHHSLKGSGFLSVRKYISRPDLSDFLAIGKNRFQYISSLNSFIFPSYILLFVQCPPFPVFSSTHQLLLSSSPLLSTSLQHMHIFMLQWQAV